MKTNIPSHLIKAAALWLCATLAGCVDDMSEGPVVPLDEVMISGIDDRYTDVYVGRTLSIRPVVNNLSGDASRLEYYWITYNRTTQKRPDTLSREKDLNVEIHLIPGEHTVKFKAVDRPTGVFYEKEFTISVVNDFTNGLLILGRTGDNALLHFWVPGRDEVITDVYGKLNNGQSVGQHPRRVVFTPYTSELASEVLVLCDDGQGGRILDNTTMAYKRDYADLFFGTVKNEYRPQAYFRSSMREYLVDGGLLYDRAVNSNPPDSYVRPNMSSSLGTYAIAPDADFGDDVESTSRMVVYDNLNTCFYVLYDITSAYLTTVKNTSGMQYVDGGSFNPDNVGMECIYAGLCSRSATGAREYAGVFRDNAGALWLLRAGIGFWVENASPDRYFKDIDKVRIESPDIAAATSFTCGAALPDYLFYAAGSSIYAYSMTGRTGQKVFDFNAGGGTFAIDRIEMERGGRRLWVAFRNLKEQHDAAGFAGLQVQTDGGLQVREDIRHEGLADEIVDFESKY